jgi:hypothetical protein
MGHLVIARQRRAIRKAYRTTCRVHRESDFRLVGDEALDVSPDGMLVVSESDMKLGEECIVSFRATELGLWFDSVATITRVVRGRRPGDPGPAIGLRFDTMDAVHRLILRGHLRKIPPPLPKREQRIDYAATIHKIAFG